MGRRFRHFTSQVRQLDHSSSSKFHLQLRDEEVSCYFGEAPGQGLFGVKAVNIVDENSASNVLRSLVCESQSGFVVALKDWIIVLSALAAVLLASCCSAFSAQVNEGVFGCWARKDDAPKHSTELDKARSFNKVILCFHPGGILSGGYLEPTGEGGSIEGVWNLNDPRLKINESLCLINMESGGQNFKLSGCDYSGQWSLACRDPDSALRCPKK